MKLQSDSVSNRAHERRTYITVVMLSWTGTDELAATGAAEICAEVTGAGAELCRDDTSVDDVWGTEETGADGAGAAAAEDAGPDSAGAELAGAEPPGAEPAGAELPG